MASMTSVFVASRETSRLHRWAMWRMTVNDGIITCIRDQGTSRVLFPDSSYPGFGSDGLSLHSGSGTQDPLKRFPFITPEQMSLARKMNLRDKYGTGHGLSDDAYFIFGLPRISMHAKDIPEVRPYGICSMYGSVNDLTSTTDLIGTSPSNNVTHNNYNYNYNHNAGPSANLLMPVNESYRQNTRYPDFGPTPDDRSLASLNDVEVQRINGYRFAAHRREDASAWSQPAPPAGPASPVPRLNLYSIEEEFNNSINNSKEDYARYINADNYGDVVNRKDHNRQSNSYEWIRLADDLSDAADRSGANFYNHIYGNVDSGRFSYAESGRTYDDVDVAPASPTSQNLYASPAFKAASPPPVSTKHHSLNRFSNTSAPSQPHAQEPIKHEVYPPFSPNRPGYSSSPSSPKRSYFPSPNGYAPSVPSQPRSRSTSPDRVRRVSSPVGHDSRPTRPTVLGDVVDVQGNLEKEKRQAYYDWTTPTTERYIFSDFAAAYYNRFR